MFGGAAAQFVFLERSQSGSMFKDQDFSERNAIVFLCLDVKLGFMLTFRSYCW